MRKVKCLVFPAFGGDIKIVYLLLIIAITSY